MIALKNAPSIIFLHLKIILANNVIFPAKLAWMN
jgi:hypothetical protein